MARLYEVKSKLFFKNYLTKTLVKSFHRRKTCKRALKKFEEKLASHNRLGEQVGVYLSLHRTSPKSIPTLQVDLIKLEESKEFVGHLWDKSWHNLAASSA
jgi:hypothetical protein